ncbi:MAG: hypothetical protein F6K19_47425 [Cyanothece sp. SIO1E1]|nr:hypothetical protein [Cyanothece sp. SIO1E1]
MVVITGGEPCIHDLTELTHALRTAGHKIHLETAGAFSIRGTFDWITLSPKEQKLPKKSNLQRSNEFKLIVDKPGAIQFWEDQLGDQFDNRPIWLNPEWSRRKEPAILKEINAAVKEGTFAYRAGYQLHKLYQVDEEDRRSKPAIELRLPAQLREQTPCF